MLGLSCWGAEEDWQVLCTGDEVYPPADSSMFYLQICSSMEAPTQMLVRNRNEVLRCFTVLGKRVCGVRWIYEGHICVGTFTDARKVRKKETKQH